MASILVTAGPTHEHLDDVRYFANGSSGRMGYALAAAAVASGHVVHLVSGPTTLAAPATVAFRGVTSALEMQAAVDAVLADAAPAIDLVVAVAAVADYRPRERSAGKPKKGETGLTVELVPNPDILRGLGQRKATGELSAVLVGFALECGDRGEILRKGRDKLQTKNLDMIVVNHASAMGALDNEVTLVFADGTERELPRGDKADIAREILSAAIGLLPRGEGS